MEKKRRLFKRKAEITPEKKPKIEEQVRDWDKIGRKVNGD